MKKKIRADNPSIWAFTTYFAEGFPYSIIRTVSSLFFRDMKMSLEGIGLTSLFGLPWVLKFLWAPLASGGSVYLETNIETGLSTHFDTIETKGLTHAVFSASMINEQEIRAVSSLKYLISGGSEINQAVINKLGNTKLVNCYGPTE